MKLQKRLGASVLGVGKSRVKCDPVNHDVIKEGITKTDVRKLIRDGVIRVLPARGISKGRAKVRAAQKRKGRRRGFGLRKGRATARQNPKRTWMNKIRAQRRLLSELKETKLITIKDYHTLYYKAKGGFFRSVGHIKLYIKEHNLLRK